MKHRFNTHDHVRRTVAVALFAAMSFAVALFVRLPVGFLTLDVKDAVQILCGLYFGPAAVLALALLVPLLEFITISTTGAYGLIMNILGSMSFGVVTAFIYKYRKTLCGAILALFSGAFCMVSVMLVANLFITPYYMGVSTEAVRGMIPTLLLPFNVTKAVLNVGVVLLLYKPLSRALRRTSLLPPSSTVYRFDRRTLWVQLLAISLLVASALMLVLYFKVFS